MLHIFRYIGIALLLLPNLVIAQELGDVMACADESLSIDARRDFFSSVSWTDTKPDSREVAHAVIFLGNVDATQPSSWNDTHVWAKDLSAHLFLEEHYVYALKNSAVVLTTNESGDNACLIVSDETFIDRLIDNFPNAHIVKNGPRTWVSYNKEPLRLMASDFPLDEQGSDVWFKDGYSFSATFVTRNPKP